jgi:hypothetical protein
MNFALIYSFLQRLLRTKYCGRVLPSMRALRMSTFYTFVFGVLTLVSGRSVYGDTLQVGMGIGHQLASLEELTGDAYRVRINGAELNWASNTTQKSVDEVLDRYESYCRKSPSSLGEAMQDIPKVVADSMPLKAHDPERAAVIRQTDKGRGLVACFVSPAGSAHGAAHLGEALKTFGETGDLSKLGHFRYVFAEQRRRHTRVVTLWSDGPLIPGAMFPREGDAPGTDAQFAVRPPSSLRTLSVSIDGFAAGVHAYETSETPALVFETEDRALRAKGFEKVDRVNAASGTSAYFRNDGVEVILSATRSETNPERTTVAIVESGAAIRMTKVEKSK